MVNDKFIAALEAELKMLHADYACKLENLQRSLQYEIQRATSHGAMNMGRECENLAQIRAKIESTEQVLCTFRAMVELSK